MHNLRHFRFLAALVLGFSLTAAPVVWADQIVYFVNGKAITVKKVEKGDKLTILEIDGGGRIGVPTVQIDRVEEFQLSPPAAAIPAPVAVTPAAPQSVAPALPAAAGPAGAAAAIAGPGIGGKPTAPSANVAGLKPLAVGEGAEGDGQASAAGRPRGVGGVPPGMAGAVGPGANVPAADGVIGRPGIGGMRRFPNRNGALGRGRPNGNYYIPPPAQAQQPGQGPAKGQTPTGQQPASPGPGNQQGATNPTPPAAQTPPPPPPPDHPPEPPASGQDGQSADDGSNNPPPDDPGTSEPPADDEPPGGNR